ncbi:TRAP transporter substrate-binding protein [Halomonas dongshanensis]|uniref:TRAP transporter substrate-binding protein n=1 Tax=Halomonas dongshanensis TaxID=2890835 RepID=A0ABT2EAX5_9GAMM|nr:TRAP transporter substrate-binding protein [Halomonas dongshanensis]MCS2608726.1 TRAP transporter substrate-binding protein [Halomonas dongshanensis]
MRRSHLALGSLVAAGCLLLTACSDDTDSGERTVVLTAGHQLATGTSFHQGLEKFAELVDEKTQGRVQVRVHPNAQLGNETEMFRALQSGTVDVGLFAPGSIAEYYPGITLLSMPYLLEDRAHRDQVLESGILEPMEANIIEATGAEILTYFGGSQRQMFFTEEVSSLDDIQGRLFRVQPSQMLTESYASMGLEPTVVAYTELYNALEQGVVQGAENEPIFIESQKFFEPAPYIVLTGHEVTVRPVMISNMALDKLDDELAGQVREAALEAGEFERQTEGEADQEMLERLASQDGVVMTEVDTTALRSAMEPIWQKYAEEWNETELLSAIRGL